MAIETKRAELPVELLGGKQVAKMLGVSRKFIESHRSLGDGPKWYKIGGCCKYDPRDVLEWLAERQRVSPGRPVRTGKK